LRKKTKIVSLILIVLTFFTSVTIANSIEINSGYYLAKMGDSVDSIASQFSISSTDLKDWNHLSDPPIIFPGKLLIISQKPVSTPTPSYVQKGFVSINYVDTDIRDILNVVAVVLKKDIMYIGPSMRFSIKASKVANKDLLDVVVNTAGGMIWVTSGNLIIVGPKDKISVDFQNNMVFTGIDLKYITSPELVLQIEKLGIDVKTLTLKQTLKKIWLQGIPSEISRVYSLLNSLDLKANFPTASIGQTTKGTFFKEYYLKYMTAKTLQTLLGQFKIPVLVGESETNPQLLFVSGPLTAKEGFENLLAQLDIKANSYNPASGDLVGMTKYVLKYIAFSDAANLLEQSKLDIKVMQITNFPKTIFFFGAKQYRDEAMKLLSSVDSPGQLVTQPVDSGPSTSKLAARRNLICDLTGLRPYSFNISADINREEGTSEYILYYTGKEAEIAKVRSAIKQIDAPLGG